MWARIADAVMRRPVPVMTVALVLLLTLGSPFLGARFGLTDDRALPATVSSRQVGDAVRTQFGAGESTPLYVVSSSRIADPPLAAFARRLSAVAGVRRVETRLGAFVQGRAVPAAAAARSAYAGPHGTAINVVSSAEAFSPEGSRLVRAIRAVPAPAAMLVGGPSARLVDTSGAIRSRIPLALLVMGLAVGTLLFLFTGSLVLPLKAIVLNLLSLTATFGAMVWIFQEGHLRGLFGDFTVTGLLDVTAPILMFCVAFGLSMDYEVFILSRIREEWERTGDAVRSVALGLQRTGPLVTSAAVLVALVFASFATSSVTTIKLFGTGVAVAVIVDATIVRAALLPALMRLMGRANWWAPAPLRALHARAGLREAPDRADPGPLRPASAHGTAE